MSSELKNNKSKEECITDTYSLTNYGVTFAFLLSHMQKEMFHFSRMIASTALVYFVVHVKKDNYATSQFELN